MAKTTTPTYTVFDVEVVLFLDDGTTETQNFVSAWHPTVEDQCRLVITTYAYGNSKTRSFPLFRLKHWDVEGREASREEFRSVASMDTD